MARKAFVVRSEEVAISLYESWFFAEGIVRAKGMGIKAANE